MNKIQYKTTKKEHKRDCSCSICGLYKGISFKNGYVCEPCLEYIKNSYTHITDTTRQNK